MRVAVTRPQADAERTAAALRARGHTALLAPLTRIENIAAEIGPGPWSAILISSANAARAVATHPRCAALTDLPVLAVGQRSAEAARMAGFSDVTSADGDVDDLARLAAAHFAAPAAALLYLAGADLAGDLAGALAKHRLAVATAVVYRATETPFPRALAATLRVGALDAVLHFSHRGAELYLQGAAAAGVSRQALAPRHCCLSPQVAEPLQRAGAAAIAVATRPEESALIDLLGPP